MNIKKITRVSIFIDYDNFAITYKSKKGVKENEIQIWNNLNNVLLTYYQNQFIKNDFEITDHTGTYLCVGMNDTYILREDIDYKKRFQALDRKLGFIVKYGYRKRSFRDKKGNFHLGKEKGVDAEIICQMLMGAFLDHYDSCILLSDDGDYIPAVRRVQDYFGKKVIQAGFEDSMLRNQAFGHIAFEECSPDFHELIENEFLPKTVG